jgi:Ig-like domain CHU_C associated/PKD domain/Secretion system C-terminal sorting domain
MGNYTISFGRGFFLLLFFLLAQQGLRGQCGVNTQSGVNCPRSATFYGEVLPNGGCGVPTNVTNYSPGTHFRIPVLQGGCYSVSTCGSGMNTQVAAFQANNLTGPFSWNDDNGPLCAGTSASVTFVPSFTDYARVDIRQSNCSAGGTSSITLQVMQNNNLAFTSSGAPLCQGQNRVLTATPAPVAVPTQPNSGNTGTISGSNISAGIFTAPIPSSGMQTYNVTYTFGYCSTTQGLDVYRAPSIANAGNNFSVCSATATMAGNVPTYGTGTWAILTGPGAVTTPNAYNSALTGLVAGSTTTLTWTISNGPCAVTRDTVAVYREILPTTALASANQAICATTTSVTANTPLIGSGLWYLFAGSGNIATPAGPNTVLNTIGPGTNIFIWSITNGVCPPSNDTVTIIRDLPPTPAFAGPDIAMCDSSINLNGNTPIVGSGLWALLTGSGSLVTPANPNTALNNVPIGTSTFTWTTSNGACPNSIDTLTVLRNNRPNAPTVVGVTNVCEGSQTLLTASSSATIPNFKWWSAPVGGTLLASTAAFSTPPVTATVTYYVEVTDASTACPSNRVAVQVNMMPNPAVSLGPDRLICSNDTTCFTAPPNMVSYIWSNGITNQFDCFGDSGNVWVQISDINSCIGRDTAHISFVSALPISLGNDTTFCQGGSITIGNFVGANSYQWSTGAATSSITVNAAGTYSVTCTAPGGCIGVDTILVMQSAGVNAAFTVDTTFCPQIVFVDNSTGSTSWAWTFGDNSTSTAASPIHIYGGNGTFTVTLTTTGTCGSDVATQSVPVNCLVGLNMPSNLTLAVYPNPNEGAFKVQFGGLESDAEVAVYNELGQVVFQKSLLGLRGDFETTVDMGHPAAGVYLLKLKIGDATIAKRVLVK